MLDWAGVLAADVAGRTVTTPEGLTWSNTEHTATPPELPPEPGFMQGSAGMAGWLARLHALHTCVPGAAPVTRPARPGSDRGAPALGVAGAPGTGLPSAL